MVFMRLWMKYGSFLIVHTMDVRLISLLTECFVDDLDGDSLNSFIKTNQSLAMSSFCST